MKLIFKCCKIFVYSYNYLLLKTNLSQVKFSIKSILKKYFSIYIVDNIFFKITKHSGYHFEGFSRGNITVIEVYSLLPRSHLIDLVEWSFVRLGCTPPVVSIISCWTVVHFPQKQLSISHRSSGCRLFYIYHKHQ